MSIASQYRLSVTIHPYNCATICRETVLMLFVFVCITTFLVLAVYHDCHCHQYYHQHHSSFDITKYRERHSFCQTMHHQHWCMNEEKPMTTIIDVHRIQPIKYVDYLQRHSVRLSRQQKQQIFVVNIDDQCRLLLASDRNH